MQPATLWGLALVLVLGAFGLNQPTLAQQTTASITGTVEDAGGAALDGATVTAKDTERGTAYTAKSSNGGLFNFNNLPIGNYEVKAEAAASLHRGPAPHHSGL